MSKLPTQCPACSELLQVSRLSCPECEMQLEGRFALPMLLRLPPDDLEFILAFVRSSGSLKEMGKLRGQSYPTVRNRLDEIIARLSPAPDELEEKRRRILDAIVEGELSVKEAARKLKELGS